MQRMQLMQVLTMIMDLPVLLYHILLHRYVCMCCVVDKSAVFVLPVVDSMPQHLVVIAI